MKQKNLKKVIINKYIKMKLQGKLVKKLQVESGTTNNGTEWKNQTLVFEHVFDNGIPEWAKQFAVKVGNKKDARVNVDMTHKLQIGTIYDISVNVNSREYNGKYFTNLNMWSCAEASLDSIDIDSEDNNENDDLPF